MSNVAVSIPETVLHEIVSKVESVHTDIGVIDVDSISDINVRQQIQARITVIDEVIGGIRNILTNIIAQKQGGVIRRTIGKVAPLLGAVVLGGFATSDTVTAETVVNQVAHQGVYVPHLPAVYEVLSVEFVLSNGVCVAHDLAVVQGSAHLGTAGCLFVDHDHLVVAFVPDVNVDVVNNTEGAFSVVENGHVGGVLHSYSDAQEPAAHSVSPTVTALVVDGDVLSWRARVNVKPEPDPLS